MKKIILIILISFVSIIGKAQTLQNSTWSCYSPADVFFRYYFFSTDTVYFATDTASFTAFATFTESANTVIFVDFSGQCTGVPGQYTYLIQNDTLRFTIVNDPCSQRSSIFGSYYLVNLLSDIKSPNSKLAIEVFPNPSNNGIFNISLDKNFDKVTKVTVVNNIGIEVLSEEFLDNSLQQTVDIQDQPSGTYFMVMQNGGSKKIYTIVK